MSQRGLSEVGGVRHQPEILFQGTREQKISRRLPRRGVMRLVGLSLERIAIFCREPLVNRLDLDDLAPGDKGVICSFGAGYSVGSVLVERG